MVIGFPLCDLARMACFEDTDQFLFLSVHLFNVNEKKLQQWFSFDIVGAC